jgi:hypothetical protein
MNQRPEKRSLTSCGGEALASEWMAAVADQGEGELVGCLFLRSVGKVQYPEPAIVRGDIGELVRDPRVPCSHVRT